MALYSFEEICEGCIYANFHACCGKFCHCDNDNEEDVDGTRKYCEFKKINKDEN